MRTITPCRSNIRRKKTCQKVGSCSGSEVESRFAGVLGTGRWKGGINAGMGVVGVRAVTECSFSG